MNIRVSFIFLLVCVLTSCTSSKGVISQKKDINGFVTYVVGSYLTKEEKEEKLSSMNEEQRKQYGSMMKKVDEQVSKLEYTLLFNAKKSLFKVKESLSEENPMEEMVRKIALGSISGNALYLNDLGKGKKIEQHEYSNEIVNVLQPQNEYKWEITGEIKKIGSYECRKATTKVEEFHKGETIIREITAWYSLDIPVPFGPRGIDGLPGMILELHWNKDGHYFLYASSVEIGEGIAEDKDITLPRSGTEISKKKWDDFQEKENQRIRQRKN